MKIVRYFFVGAAAAAVDFSLFAILAVGMGIHWFPAGVISFLLATSVNYFLSIRHVFDSGVRFSRKREIQLVFLVSGIGLALNQSFLWLMIESVGVPLLLSKIIATGGVFFWNYGARNYIIFRPS